jgi:quinolinate synthase
LADFVGSTSQICRYAKASHAEEFIIGTEVGILHKLRKENPDKVFLPAYGGATCNAMKLTTLERLYRSLRDEQNLVTVPVSVAKKASKSLDRMFALIQ